MPATINIATQDILSQNLSTNVYFTLLENLAIEGSTLRVGTRKSVVTNTSGVASVSLSIGNYLVEILDRKFNIGVVANTTYNLVDIINLPAVDLPSAGLPTGGTTGQVLAKNSSGNYDVGWTDGGGETTASILTKIGNGLVIDDNYIPSTIARDNEVAEKQNLVVVGQNANIPVRYRTDGTDDQIQIQNAIDDVTDPANILFGYKVIVHDVNVTRNASLLETVGGFTRRLAIRLRDGLQIEFAGKVTFSSGGNSNTRGGSSTFTTVCGNWGNLKNVNIIRVRECDGLSTITGADSDEHGFIWLDSSSQGGCQVENVKCHIEEGHNTATALFRFRGGNNSTTQFVKNCEYSCKNGYDIDAISTISRNADAIHNGDSVINRTFAEGIIVDGSRKLTILGRLEINDSVETGLRISDNFSSLTNTNVVVNGNIIINRAEKHGVLLSGIKRGLFNGLEVRDSHLNAIRITNEGGNNCEELSFKNIKLVNANLGNASVNDDSASLIFLNSCDNVTFDASCTFGDDQTVKTTSRVANFTNATNVTFNGCQLTSTDFNSATLFNNVNTTISNKLIDINGLNPHRMNFVTVTTTNPSINLRNGDSQKITFNQNITFDDTNLLQENLIRGQELTLIFEQGSGGANPNNYTVTIAETSNIKPKASFTVETGIGALTTLRLMFISSAIGWVEVGRTSNSIPQSAVTNLTTDLADKANLSGATFTGIVGNNTSYQISRGTQTFSNTREEVSSYGTGQIDITSRGDFNVYVDTNNNGSNFFNIKGNGMPTVFSVSDTGDVVANGNISTQQFSTTKQNFTPTGNTQTINWNNGSVIDLILSSATGNVTLTLSNPISATTYLIEVTNGATARNLIFPAGTLQAEGGSNTYVGIANTKDLIAVMWDGTNYFINVSRNYS